MTQKFLMVDRSVNNPNLFKSSKNQEYKREFKSLCRRISFQSSVGGQQKSIAAHITKQKAESQKLSSPTLLLKCLSYAYIKRKAEHF